MAQSTPLIPVASVTPITFYFTPTDSVKIALHFYDSAGTAIDYSAGGSRDLLGVIPIAAFEGTVANPEPIDATDWRPARARLNVPGGGFGEFSLGEGAGVLKVAASGGSNPAGAVYYRLVASGAPTRAQS